MKGKAKYYSSPEQRMKTRRRMYDNQGRVEEDEGEKERMRQESKEADLAESRNRC